MRQRGRVQQARYPQAMNEDEQIDAARYRAEQQLLTLLGVMEIESTRLAQAWEAIEKAGEKTKQRDELLQSGHHRLYWQKALTDLLDVRDEAMQEIKNIANLLNRELGMSTRQIAALTDVSHSTVNRWIVPIDPPGTVPKPGKIDR